VIEQCSPVNFLIQKSEKADPLVVHMDKLKLVEGSNPPSWLQADQNNIADGDTFSPPTGTNSLDEPCQRSTLRESDAVTSCFGENEHQLGKRITRQPRWMADYAC
jgi:hypothetical protein